MYDFKAVKGERERDFKIIVLLFWGSLLEILLLKNVCRVEVLYYFFCSEERNEVVRVVLKKKL